LQGIVIKDRLNQLEKLVKQARKKGIQVSTKVLVGTPFLEIIREVLHNHYYLVIKSAESKATARQVKFMGQEFAVKAKIHTLRGFSAHAGQSQLLDWAGQFQKKRPHLYLVHGELDKMLALQNKLHEEYNWHANIPAPGETIQL